MLLRIAITRMIHPPGLKSLNEGLGGGHHLLKEGCLDRPGKLVQLSYMFFEQDE